MGETMSLMDKIGYICIAPAPLWFFIILIYYMYFESKYGPVCKKCDKRHWGIGNCVNGVTPFPWGLIIGLLVGLVVVLIVNFTPY